VRRIFQSMQRRAVLRIGSLVIVLITVASLAAPVALADKWGAARTSESGATLRPDDRSGVRGVEPAAVASDLSEVRRHLRPDDRSAVRGSGPTLLAATAALRPDDRSGVRSSGPTLLAAPVAPIVTIQTQDASFQWGDAGIGAGVVFVAMILVVGGIVLVARQRSARASTI
jgi:hypothetical protein